MTGAKPRNLMLNPKLFPRVLTARSAFLFPAILCIGFSAQAETSRTRGNKTLFQDDHHIAEMTGLRRVMHRPKKYGPVLRPDGIRLQADSAPVWDPKEGVYKLFCRGFPTRRVKANGASTRSAPVWPSPKTDSTGNAPACGTSNCRDRSRTIASSLSIPNCSACRIALRSRPTASDMSFRGSRMPISAASPESRCACFTVLVFVGESSNSRAKTITAC